MTTAAADVVVIGAGVIGCAIGRELGRRGVTVLVLERDAPGRQASWAAAGMLSPLGDPGRHGAFLDLCDASLGHFASFVHELREETGIDVEYRTTGRLRVVTAHDDDLVRRLTCDPIASHFAVTLLDGEAARAVEPTLADDVSRALLIGRDHRVDNRLLAQALPAAATSAGAQIFPGSGVAAIEHHAGAITGVRLESGDRIAATGVVVAAGAWSASIAGLPRVLPIRPAKGQMFAVDRRVTRDPRTGAIPIHRAISSSDCYMIPRADGRLLVGATVEDVGFHTGVTPRGMSALMNAAMAIVPAVADMPLLETWSGFRPATPDGLPVLGPDSAIQGLFYATGHFRNGILLTPITALCIADLVTGATPRVDLTEFAVARFAGPEFR